MYLYPSGEFEIIATMDKEADIPLPLRFNPFKHHRNYILDIIKTTSSGVIIGQMDPVCNNYTDIYTGSMSPVAICNAVITILKSNHVLLADDFTRWIASKNGYRKIKLEDQSEWIVRESAENERYIHIHPARTGPFTLRFKGSTLKTVCLLKITINGIQQRLSLEEVNRVRRGIGLSPVKKLEKSTGILKCYKLFLDRELHF
jgi:hypothetical protein